MKSTTFAFGLVAAFASTASAWANSSGTSCGVYQISDGQPQWVPCPSTSTTATCDIYEISDGQPQYKPCSSTPTSTYSPPPSSCVVYQISDGQPQYVPCSSTTSVPMLTVITTTTPVVNSTYSSPSPTSSAAATFTGAASVAQPELAAGGLLGLAIAMGYLVL